MNQIFSWIKVCSHCDRYVPAESTACEVCFHPYIFHEFDNNELEIPFSEIVESITEAYYLFEHFSLGNIKDYKSFNFMKHFKLLFLKAKFGRKNNELINHYWRINEQIRDYSNRSLFKNRNYWKNQDFGLDCLALQEVNDTLEAEFQPYIDKEDFETSRAISIEGIGLKSKESRIAPTPANLKKLITFDSPESLNKVFNALKDYFAGDEPNLSLALEGNTVDKPLFFPGNQNVLADLFLRLHDNGKLLNAKTKTCEWLCSNFTFRFFRGVDDQVRSFNRTTVLDLLNKGKGIPQVKARIYKEEWPPMKEK